MVFTTGGGGTLRSQRFRLWTRAARALADIGIASVRMEFAGIGDSTGEVVMGFKNLPVDDLLAVARFSMAVTGPPGWDCAGTAEGRARRSRRSRSSHVREHGALLAEATGSHREGKPLTTAGVRFAHRLPDRPRRALATMYFRMQERSKRGNDVISALRRVGGSTDLLLVETRSKLAGEMPRIVESLQAGSDGHLVEMRGVDSTSMQAFQSLEDQAETVEMVTEWFDRSFSRQTSLDDLSGPDSEARDHTDLAS